MRNLTQTNWRQKVSERVKKFAEKSNTQNLSQANHDRDYIQLLENLISAILQRTPEQREKDISDIIHDLKLENNFALLLDKVGSHFGYDFFKNEYDIEFKQELAKRINDLLKLRSDYKYNSVFLQGIAEGTTEFSELLTYSIKDLLNTYLNTDEDGDDEDEE